MSFGPAIGSLLWTGLGAVIAWNGWQSHTDEQERVGDAVEVQAEITDLGVTETQQATDENEAGPRTTRTEYAPRVTFEYAFEGDEYTSDNVEPPSAGADTTVRYPDESGARSHLEEYDEGQTVTAYVDPDAPGEGFLERETNTVRNLAIVGVGGLMMVVGVAALAASVVVL
ncbi:DUF3592 domain-containing protein [Halobellus sp. MBLA0160]|uniref:DUF3592 domain-containing protein n=1 Tax=Halobellus ruber TaxID=2761102 RepID=A0A7J9SP95_9EURY|nr:DUF3592 domain-containing protein [Halobellus ruber]